MLFKINRFHAFALVTWQFAIFFASQLIFPIFSNYVPKWRCVGSNSTFAKDCKVYETCKTNVEFENNYFHSSAIEYKWICGPDAYFASLYGQIQFVGALLGTILFGSLSDCFGRKPISLIVVGGGLIATVCSGLAPSWQLLLLSRFFIGLSIGGTIVVVCTFVMESILPEQRMALRAFFNWGTARLMLTLICYFFPDWRSASIACAVMACPMILTIVFVFPESPTWLHNKGRLQEMRESEKKAARFAGVKYVEKEPDPIVRNKSILDLLRDGTLVKRISVLWCMWFTAAICGYATDFNSSNISGHLYINQVLFSVLIAFSKILLVTFDTLYPAFSRRNLHQFSQLIVIISFLILTVLVTFDEHSIWILIVNLAGTMFIEYTWDACYLVAVESMPTNVRATSMGTCSLMARLGAIFAPLLAYLNHLWAPSAYLAVVLLGLVNLLISYAWLVETKGVNLDKVKLEGTTEEEMKMLPVNSPNNTNQPAETEIVSSNNNNA
ncbi:hypothetical protein M3Y94_00389200 [Aphelenchoides besseyi]|nr:hypothetical protein M3Y94_00389200 [Aphelenchoides besseyi]KAI6235013.1 hypothetical protein M3Y95_00006600 [Aphelenchoides besseyi]